MELVKRFGSFSTTLGSTVLALTNMMSQMLKGTPHQQQSFNISRINSVVESPTVDFSSISSDNATTRAVCDTSYATPTALSSTNATTTTTTKSNGRLWSSKLQHGASMSDRKRAPSSSLDSHAGRVGTKKTRLLEHAVKSSGTAPWTSVKTERGGVKTAAFLPYTKLPAPEEATPEFVDLSRDSDGDDELDVFEPAPRGTQQNALYLAAFTTAQEKRHKRPAVNRVKRTKTTQWMMQIDAAKNMFEASAIATTAAGEQ
jgi:hypothetical protein